MNKTPLPQDAEFSKHAPQVGLASNSVEIAISSLDDALTELESRLQLVCRQDDAIRTSSPSSRDMFSAPLAERIQSSADRIGWLRDRVTDLLNRLEV